MATTYTGKFPIAFRRGWSDWQKDLGSVIKFAKDNGFEAIDVGAISPEELKQITAAGLKIGSVDLKDWGKIGSADAGKRKEAAQANAEYIKKVVPLGAKIFFTVAAPENDTPDRKANFGYVADGYGQLCQAIESTGAKIVIEGYPGGPPNFSILACTPSEYRALIKAVGSPALGINFDPSHLIRMGIDPVRFLSEFASKVYHVHGKDTEIMTDEIYEYGDLQADINRPGHGFGEKHWRYTIPGHGIARWRRLFTQLQAAGYKGFVSIELEDENFNGSTEGEQRGLLASRDFLKYA
jgi:sugar phosphate isomerase/epimerase